jgi:hypothetical protein
VRAGGEGHLEAHGLSTAFDGTAGRLEAVPTENLKRDMTISRSARIRDIGVIPGKVEPPHGEQDG